MLNHLKDFQPPWNVEIYSNGDLIGSGVLLDKSWILAEKSTALENLDKNYLVAVVGHAKSSLNIQSPYEEISTIDCVKEIKYSNVVMMHVKQPFHFNRHVLPSFLPTENEFIEGDACLAISVSGMSALSMKSLNLTVIKDCGGKKGAECYQINDGNGIKSEVCSDNESE